jgi:hypothetical protein
MVATSRDNLFLFDVINLKTKRNSMAWVPGATRFLWEVVVLERGPLSLVSTIEELLEAKSSGFCLETVNMAVGISHADHEALYICKRWH